MTPYTGQTRSKIPRVAAAGAALMMGLAACSEDPFSFNWDATPDTTQIYSIARPEPNLLTGYQFFAEVAVRIDAPDATGTWDIALDTEGSELVLLPPGALGVTARAAIATVGTVAFDDVVRAPEDTLAYEMNNPVPVTAGTVYVVRSNRRDAGFGRTCVYYAKVEPVVIDVPGGSLTFRHVASKVCNSLELVPPD